MARKEFPKAGSLYVELPKRFSSKGTCQVYDLSAGTDPIGEISYESVVVGGQPKFQLTVGDEKREVEAVAGGTPMLKTGSSLAPMPGLPEIDAALLAKKYPDPVQLGRKMALLFTSGKDTTRVAKADVEGWMAANGFDKGLLVPMTSGLMEIGVRTSDPESFNLRAAKSKFRFDEHARVRVHRLTSEDYQECGRVVKREKRQREGNWYLVQVDGSEDGTWFHEDSLELNEAGIVVDPVPEPIEDD